MRTFLRSIKSIGNVAVLCLACSSHHTRTVEEVGVGGSAGSASTSDAGTGGTSSGGDAGSTSGGAGGGASSNTTASDSGGTASDSGGTASDTGGAAGDSDGSTSDGGVSGGSGGSTTSQGMGGTSSTMGGGGVGGSSIPTDEAPVPGADGELTILEQTFTSVELSWAPASDDVTPASVLEYQVVRSLEDNLETLELVDEYGTALTDWVPDIDTAIVDIAGGVDNYLVVVVRDQADNRALYEMLEIPFEEAETCGVPGDCFSGTCRISYRDRDGDNYGVTSEATGRCDGSIPAGYAAEDGDCCDDGGNFGLAADIHPNQTSYFPEAANICDITWDYDCSGVVEVEHETRNLACADDAEAPECPVEVVTITEEHCGVLFYGCGCGQAGSGCSGTCAGPGSPMGCH